MYWQHSLGSSSELIPSLELMQVKKAIIRLKKKNKKKKLQQTSKRNTRNFESCQS